MRFLGTREMIMAIQMLRWLVCFDGFITASSSFHFTDVDRQGETCLCQSRNAATGHQRTQSRRKSGAHCCCEAGCPTSWAK